MKLFSALVAICKGNPPVTDGFPSHRPVAQSFDIFFSVRLNKRLSRPSRFWLFQTPSRSLWRHCNCIPKHTPIGKLLISVTVLYRPNLLTFLWVISLELHGAIIWYIVNHSWRIRVTYHKNPQRTDDITTINHITPKCTHVYGDLLIMKKNSLPLLALTFIGIGVRIRNYLHVKPG